MATAKETRFEQRGFDRDVVLGFLDAAGDVAHAVADVQSDIPEQANQRFEARFAMYIHAHGDEDQQIDVGRREQFAAAVAADRRQRDFRRHGQIAPEFAQYAIDEAGAAAQ